MEEKVFVSIPTHDNRCAAGIVSSIVGCSQSHFVGIQVTASSLLTKQFNQLWVDALKRRDNGVQTHFLMLHSDIVPNTGWWLDVMVKEMRDTGADILSVVSPIKNTLGLTSTGLETDNKFRTRRFTMTEVMEKPVTWTEPGLVINTGLMLVDLRKPWVDKVHFRIEDTIINGQAAALSEDWAFSMDARKLGAKIFATRAVALEHWGVLPFMNNRVWGSKKTDDFR